MFSQVSRLRGMAVKHGEKVDLSSGEAKLQSEEKQNFN